MQRTIFKTICVFTLVFFVMSMTGAAVDNIACSKSKTDARDDQFTCNCKSKSCCYNVLSNDKGSNLKVTTTGTITTSQGGKVTMQSNGKFCYTKSKSCSKSCTDSFKYCVKGKDGKTDCATVTIKVKCSGCSSCSTC
ncbi:MAG: Ig-like domain-containing protein [Methanosarcina barkeri]|nr:Ig-like domain-containing protein [Methanosarcina sp. ERenArc_MAG2]